MDHISTILSKVLKKHGLHDHAEAAQVTLHAQEWIISNLDVFQDQLIAKSFKDNVLYIHSHNSVASQELNMKLEDLKKYMSGHHGVAMEIRVIRKP